MKNILPTPLLFGVNSKVSILRNKATKDFTLISRNERAFTLIELMVVISIIAVLTVVGIVVYIGQAKNARDARRKSDIMAISKALEAQKLPPGTLNYPALATTFFASGAIPVDPTSTNVAADNACPGVCKYCVKAAIGTCAIADTTVAAGAPAAGSSWTVCANLEAGGSFCRSNAQ